MITALYVGSFDPFTNGHLDILTRASKLFDKILLCIANNSEKKSYFSLEDRMNVLKEISKRFDNVEVDCFDGLTVNYAGVNRKKSVNGNIVLIRGLRNSLDFEYEINMAQINSSLNTEIETLFLPTKPENSIISSSMVRELLNNNCNVSKYVPKETLKIIK